MIVFWVPVALGVLAGKLTGGRVSNLSSLPLRSLWLVLVAAAAQVVLVLAPPVPPGEGLDMLRVGLPLATAMVAAFAVLNWRLPGMSLVLLGTAANLVVITANGGLMPTSVDALARAGNTSSIALAEQHPGIRLPRSKDVMLPAEETRLPWLSDVLVSPPLPRPKVLSLGDLAIAAGIALLAAQGVRRSLAVPAMGEMASTAEMAERARQVRYAGESAA